jgi:hypothetical protein
VSIVRSGPQADPRYVSFAPEACVIEAGERLIRRGYSNAMSAECQGRGSHKVLVNRAPIGSPWQPADRMRPKTLNVKAVRRLGGAGCLWIGAARILQILDNFARLVDGEYVPIWLAEWQH